MSIKGMMAEQWQEIANDIEERELIRKASQEILDTEIGTNEEWEAILRMSRLIP